MKNKFDQCLFLFIRQMPKTLLRFDFFDSKSSRLYRRIGAHGIGRSLIGIGLLNVNAIDHGLFVGQQIVPNIRTRHDARHLVHELEE